MRDIPVGARGTFVLTVKAEHLASSFKDQALPPVLATPVLVMIVENAALNAIKPFLEPGETALGTRVDLEHLAATALGRTVAGFAQVTGVAGRRVSFAVHAMDISEEVARGTHERVIVEVAKFRERLRAKYS